eukprot:PLAT9073.3.p1 GENE.PLAT9073.3~~PLAT9073.3.p1  ORF type:complete len:128 (+),score=26.35 PLAT9073.3:32-415(+)
MRLLHTHTHKHTSHIRIRSRAALLAALDEAAYRALRRCDYLFVEALEWMDELEDERGVLLCRNPGCMEEVGSYCWSGLACSCGKQVTPAFRIDKRKVRKRYRAPSPAALRERRKARVKAEAGGRGTM